MSVQGRLEKKKKKKWQSGENSIPSNKSYPGKETIQLKNTACTAVLSIATSISEILYQETFYPVLLPVKSLCNPSPQWT